MQFQPKTEEEVVAENLCPTGLQPFTIMEAAIVVSKSEANKGKEMLKLKLNVHADDGFDYHVYDYVAPWFMAHKFRHLFFAVGCGADYQAGTVNTANLVGRDGWCDIAIGKAKDGFPAKETVKDYNVEKAAPVVKVSTELPSPAMMSRPTTADDSEIPF